jgi:hypothetical protein
MPVQLYVVKDPSEAIGPQKRAHFFLAGFVFEFFLTLSLELKGLTTPPPLLITISPESVFVSLLRSPGIGSRSWRAGKQPYLSYRPARLHRLAESIPGLLKRSQIRAQVIPGHIFNDDITVTSPPQRFSSISSGQYKLG